MRDESINLYAQLQELPSQIEEFYGAYFSELRRGLSGPEVFSEAVPDYLKGYKRVLTLGGTDGVVVVHFPVEVEITVSENTSGEVLLKFSSEPDAVRDIYEFAAPFQLPARDLAESLSNEKDIGLEITAGRPWGAIGFASPQQKIDTTTGELAWQAPWTRLICADFNSLHYWKHTGRAEAEAREDLDPYIRSAEYPTVDAVYEVLDEIEAPEHIEAAGVQAGDHGIVVEVFERPRPALLVEYADPAGRTKALVTYSPDLGRILDLFRTSSREQASREGQRRPEPVLTAHVYAAPAV
ncbi:MAG: hypothetical protein ACFB50_15775 [Rubrobacteraceae bacterium]